MIGICEICGKRRPDDKISDIFYPTEDFAQRIIKYCNDNEECMNKAMQEANSKRFL